MTESEQPQSRPGPAQPPSGLGHGAEALVHDLNNLVSVILNYAAVIDDELAAAERRDSDQRWGAVRRDVSRILVAAQRARRLTHELLRVAERRPTRGHVISINEVIDGLEPLLQATIGDDINLVTHLAPGLWSVGADASEIEQVIINLAVNARDCMPQGGTLTFKTANVVVDDALLAEQPDLRRGRYVRLQVSDTGTGMAEAVRVHAFEPFFTTKPKGEGTGLGLATVYRVVTDAGGYAQMYSEIGAGTTFTALLPATRANERRDR